MGNEFQEPNDEPPSPSRRPADTVGGDNAVNSPPVGAPPRPEHDAWAAVDVIDATGRLGDPGVGALRARVLEALGVLGCTGEVRVRIVGDAQMRDLHMQHKNQDCTTDVLTFDLRDNPEAPALDTDITVCLDEARRQSAQRGTSVEGELILYTVHGVLHCTGHDDRDEQSARLMHAREDEVLTKIGVGAVFSAETHARGGAER